MTNSQKKPSNKANNKPASRERVVYEVKGVQGTKQVNATTTAELKTALTPLLGLDPYSTQAAAHLAHVERAAVTGKGWSVKRLGVLAFVPDSDSPATPKRISAANVPPELAKETLGGISLVDPNDLIVPYTPQDTSSTQSSNADTQQEQQPQQAPQD